MFEKVLVPLDGSKLAEAILPYVSQLAKRLNVPLVVLVVASPESRRSDGVNERIAAYLQTIEDRLSGEGVQVNSTFVFGLPAEEIVRIAEQQGCSLIALSTHSEHLAGRGRLGSVTVKVVHSSPFPILTIPPSKAEQYGPHGSLLLLPQIVVPLDGSPFAESALPYVEELAQKLSGEVTLVRAFSPAYLAADPFATVAIDVGEAAEADTADYLKDAAEKLRSEGVVVHSQMFRGDPAQHLAEYTQTLPQSLIVMTTHGRSGLARWLLGSVAESILRTAEDAVLIIPRQYGRRHTLEVTDMLERASIFSALTENNLESLAQSARVRVYRPKEIIVKKGDTTGGIFIISSGKVEVVKDEDTPQPTVLGTLGPGDFFGEMSIIDDHPRSATVRVVEDTECVAIRRADFLAELQRRPEIAVHMLPVLVQRLREARESLTE